MNAQHPPGWYPLLAATASIGIANSVVFSLLSDLQDRYGFGDSGLGLIAGAGMAIGFVSQLALAPLADRGHSKRLLLAGLLVVALGFGLGALRAAVAHNAGFVALNRALANDSDGDVTAAVWRARGLAQLTNAAAIRPERAATWDGSCVRPTCWS